MQIYYNYAGFEKKNIPKVAKLWQKRPLGDFVTSCNQKSIFMIKVVQCGNPWEMGQKWNKYYFCSECIVIIDKSNNFIPSCAKALGSLVVIAFRSNFAWFCVI